MFLMFEALKWNLNPKSQIYNCTVLQNLGKPPKTRTTNVVRNAGCVRSRYTQKFFLIN